MKNPAAFNVTEEWIKDRRNDLSQEKLAEFCQLRGYNRQKLLNVFPELGWYENWHKWTIPIRNIDGKCTHVKCWSNIPGRNGAKWTTIGYGHFNKIRQSGEPSGQLFDLGWLLDQPHGRWLWITAGEFDCLMLRQLGWSATTVTVGESASSSVEFFINEFGGLKRASELLSAFKGIVLCYDCDDAGRKGMQRHAILLDKLFERIGEAAETSDENSEDRIMPLPNSFLGVRAVDLTNHDQWQVAGSPSGWDLTNLIKWSLPNKGGASNWLKEQAEAYGSGAESISALLGLPMDEHTGSPTIGDIIIPIAIKTRTFPELISAGVNYANTVGSRNHGWLHMAIVAARSGWTMDEIWYQDTNDPDDGLGPMPLFDRLTALSRKLWPGKPDMPIAEIRDCFTRAFVDYRQPASVCDDVSNVFRLSYYYPYLRYHPVKGWMWWFRTHWEVSETKAYECAEAMGNQIFEEATRLAANNGDPKLIARLRKFAASTRNLGKINAMLYLASKSPLFRPSEADEVNDWDTHPWRIGTPNGVVDLVTGELLDSRKSMLSYCSMTTRGSIVPWSTIGENQDLSNSADFWSHLIEEWQPDEENRQVLQEIAATCLIGRLQEKIFTFESDGRSGKSTFAEALYNSLGDYATVMLGSVLLNRVTDNAKSSAIAGLGGKRFVRWDEMGGGALDIEMLKQLTGEEFISGRGMRKDWGVVNNQATYVGTTNKSLNVQLDVSSALRSRIVLIKWPMTYVPAEAIDLPDYRNNPNVRVEVGGLKEALRSKAIYNVVLSWAYEGLRQMVKRDGVEKLHVHIPQSMLDDVTRMFSENNMVKAYFEESGLWRHLVHDETGEFVYTGGLLARMRQWAKTNDLTEFEEQLARCNAWSFGNLMQPMKYLGFYSQNNVRDARWAKAKYCRAWYVPYRWIGVG